MPTVGIKPNAVSYNSAITGCGRNGQWQQAVELLREMSTIDISRDVVAFHAAISACSDSGKCEQAVGLLRLVQALGIKPSESCYTTVVAACHTSERQDQAWGLEQEIVDIFGGSAAQRASRREAGTTGESRIATVNIVRSFP